MKRWISAIRPRTLPLAISGILIGTFPALRDGIFQLQIFILALLTAILLQILSNLANDYGDFIKGTDVISNRSDRALASGSIDSNSMKYALIITTVFTLFSGIWLLISAFGRLDSSFWILLAIGLISISAAIKYTVGNKAYGYRGFGDLAVLIFFGYIAVCGSYFLYCKDWLMVWEKAFLPATGMGLLSTGVLNINNIRDINSDRMNGKRTVAVILSRKGAVLYQALLVLLALTAFNLHWWFEQGVNSWVVLTLFPIYGFHTYRLFKAQDTDMESHHKLLKIFVLLTLAFVCMYGISILS